MTSVSVDQVNLSWLSRVFNQRVKKTLMVTFVSIAMGSFSVLAIAAENDPFEKVNRKLFKFNDWVDRYTLKPAAKFYKKITPKPINSGITHFFSNLNDISVTVNDVLQLKFSQAGADSARFIINTTVGLLGTVDVASRFNLPKHDEDFGQTLGVWGLPIGPYIVIPLLGPNSARGTVAYPVESYLSYYRHLNEPAERNTVKGVELIDNRASLLVAEGFISGDRYAFVREAYLQQREFLTLDGEVEDSFLDYEDEFND